MPVIRLMSDLVRGIFYMFMYTDRFVPDAAFWDVCINGEIPDKGGVDIIYIIM